MKAKYLILGAAAIAAYMLIKKQWAIEQQSVASAKKAGLGFSVDPTNGVIIGEEINVPQGAYYQPGKELVYV